MIKMYCYDNANLSEHAFFLSRSIVIEKIALINHSPYLKRGEIQHFIEADKRIIISIANELIRRMRKTGAYP